jgi:hypothetical protein
VSIDRLTASFDVPLHNTSGALHHFPNFLDSTQLRPFTRTSNLFKMSYYAGPVSLFQSVIVNYPRTPSSLQQRLRYQLARGEIGQEGFRQEVERTTTAMSSNPITCHIIDKLTGNPAKALHVALRCISSAAMASIPVHFTGITNSEGRIRHYESPLSVVRDMGGQPKGLERLFDARALPWELGTVELSEGE